MKRIPLGVGTRLSASDGVGPVVAQALAGSDWIAIDCGTALRAQPTLCFAYNRTCW